MTTNLPIEIEIGNLPLNTRQAPPDLANLIVQRMRGKVPQSKVIGGLTGTETPYDSGPALVLEAWFVWNQTKGQYGGATPTLANSGILGNSEFESRLVPSPDLDLHVASSYYQTFRDLDGTVAFIYDTLVSRPTQLIPAAATTYAVNGAGADDFYGKLGANLTISSLTVTDGQEVTVGLLNFGTGYTVTWPGTIKWPASPTHTQPANKLALYTFRSAAETIYGEMLSYNSTTDTTVSVGGSGLSKTFISANYGGSGNDAGGGSGKQRLF